jgi:hypothetical protein
VTVKEGVNKSNYPIQNPLLLVTEPRTRIEQTSTNTGKGRYEIRLLLLYDGRASTSEPESRHYERYWESTLIGNEICVGSHVIVNYE